MRIRHVIPSITVVRYGGPDVRFRSTAFVEHLASGTPYFTYSQHVDGPKDLALPISVQLNQSRQLLRWCQPSLREIAVELAKLGFVNERDGVFPPSSVQSIVL